jgi:hypothetical protein
MKDVIKPLNTIINKTDPYISMIEKISILRVKGGP